jgi:hypothetical protein
VWAAPYFGVALEREDIYVYVPNDGNCNVTYTGLMARQMQVRLIDASNGLQMGTVHKCNAVDFWFAGYTFNGTWYPQSYWDGPSNQTHSFFIARTGFLGYNEFRVDLTTLGTVNWAATGSSIHAGLHTYTDQAVASSHTYRTLVRQSSPGGGWAGWVSPVYPNIASPLMCGGFWGPTIWRASVNSSC